MLRRLIGLVMLMFALTGIAASIVGARIGIQVVDDLGRDLLDALQLVSRSLGQVESSLVLAKSTLADIGDGLSTLETTVGHLSQSVEDTGPLLLQISGFTSDTVPGSIESTQEALPGMIQVAGIIDDTLNRLSSFRIEQEVFGVPIQFDLGVEYNPQIPFDEAIQQVSDSLEGLPGELRALETNIDVARGDLIVLSEDLDAIGTDLDQLGDRIVQTQDLLDDYLAVVVEINDSTLQLRSSISGQLQNARRVIVLFAVWLGLGQLAPLYLGWESLKGRRLR